MKLVLLIPTLCIFSLSALAKEGVGHGGGGSTMPVKPVSTVEVSSEATISSTAITSYLRGIEAARVILVQQDGVPRYPEFDLFFKDGDPFTRLKKIQIRIKTDTNCQDFDGEEVDGSINDVLPDTICISADRLAKKLNQDDFRTEVPALVLHEIAHLFGANEEQAVAIQNESRLSFSRHTADSLRFRAGDLQNTTAMLMVATEGYQRVLELGAAADCTKLQNFVTQFDTTASIFNGENDLLFPIRERETEYFAQLSTRLKAAADYVCTVGENAAANERAQYKQTYFGAFSSRTSLTALEYQEATWLKGVRHINRYILNPMTISRIDSIAGAAAVFQQTVEDLARAKKMIADEAVSVFAGAYGPYP